MYLKSLEIQGFKSFPDKTVLQFGSDITAIVGPNGSGKSNISDAISWVMGEQSSRALRGAKMEDVIFGGTQKRPAVGFAEATLVLDNQDGALKIETPEVMITRRYYRSGESEYYINKQSARLRDINELLMDTGLGREGYSNIGQGRIDEILAVKSTDRREIFEEAAGISKCRYRREETERRLAATEDNLLRIGDKISELEMQVEPLRQQAEKAQKYLVLRDELKGVEITVWLDSLKKIAANAKKAEEDYASAAFILEQAHSELSSLYAASEQLSLELNRESLVLEEKRDAISASELERQQAQADQTVLQASIDNNKTNIDRVRQELADQESRSGGIAGQIEAQQARIGEIGVQLAQIDEKLRAALEESKKLTESNDETAGKLLSLRANHALLTSEAAGRRAEISSIRTALSDILERKQALEADHASALARREDTPGTFERKRYEYSVEYCDKASELVYKVEHEFDLIERKYNKLIEQKTIFAKRALARIHYILQEGADDEDNIVKLINLIDKSDKTDEILGALRNRMKFTRQFYNVTDDSFPGRRERGRSEFVPFVIDDASAGEDDMADFVPKPLYTKKELQSFRDKNMRDGMFVTDEQTVESMEDLEKLLFLWQEETNERMGEDTVSLDGEITKSDGVSYSRLVISKSDSKREA